MIELKTHLLWDFMVGFLGLTFVRNKEEKNKRMFDFDCGIEKNIYKVINM